MSTPFAAISHGYIERVEFESNSANADCVMMKLCRVDKEVQKERRFSERLSTEKAATGQNT